MQELRAELDARLTFENNGALSFGADGAPINPRGRTGMRGRGLLAQWGANHTADPIVTRREPLTGTMQVLAVRRRLTGEWSLPGGMVKAGESVSATVMRMMGLSNDTSTGTGTGTGTGESGESGEQAKLFKDPTKQKDFDVAVQALLRSGVVVYAGYVDDQRNTDNAWVESRAVHFHCPRELGEMLPLQQPGSKAASRRSKATAPEVYASWLDANRELEPRYAEMYGRHSEWVEKAIAANAKVAKAGGRSGDSHIQMEGMERHTRAFKAYSGMDVRIAQKCALSDQCVKVSSEGKREAIDDKGELVRVDSFRTCMASKHLLDHGCGLAIELYFNFHVSAGILFGLLFLVSSYTFAENYRRNALRNECRQSVREFDPSQAGSGLEFVNVSEWMRSVDSEDRCGYSQIAVGVNPDVPGWLMGAMGSCTEMTQNMRPADNSLLPGLPDTDVSIYSHLRLDSPVCVGLAGKEDNLSACYWLECISVLLLLAFFVREFYLTSKMSKAYDQAHITTSDFAVVVSGLEKGALVDDLPDWTEGLTSRLMSDLDDLGFTSQHIVQVEVARECKAEMRAMAALAALRNQRQELQAERLHRFQKSVAGGGASRRGLSKEGSFKKLSPKRGPPSPPPTNKGGSPPPTSPRPSPLISPASPLRTSPPSPLVSPASLRGGSSPEAGSPTKLPPIETPPIWNPPQKTPPKGSQAGGEGERWSPSSTPPKGSEGRVRRSSRETLQRNSTKVPELHLTLTLALALALALALT